MKLITLSLFLLLIPTVSLAQQQAPLTVVQARARYDQTVAQHDTLAMANAAYLVGKRYRASGNYVSGRQWLLFALRIWEQRGPSVELNKVYIQLVGDVLGVSNYPQAFNYAYRALANSQRLNHPHSLMSAYSCLGGLHWGVAEGQAAMHSQWEGEKNQKVAEDSAVWYLQRAETIAASLPNPKELAIIRGSQAGMLLKRDPQKAIPLLAYALSIFERQGADQSRVNSNLALSIAYTNLCQLSKAHEHLLTIEAIFRKSTQIDAHVPADVYYAWANWHRASGHWQQAYRYLHTADSLRQTAMRVTQQATIARLNVAYETDQRESQLKIQRAELALKKNQLQEQKHQNWMMLGLLVVAVTVGISFYRLSKENQRISIRNAQLVEEQNHRMNNHFQAISGMLSLQSNRLSDEDARQAVEESGLRVQTMALLNRKLYNTNRLVTMGLPAFIPDLVQSVLDSYGYEAIEPVYKLEPIPVHPDQAIPIALIINELVTNACKYAFADNPAPMLKVSCWREKNRMHVQLEDNGPGMNITPKTTGFGLYLIALQVRQLEGHFTISKPPGVTFDLSADIKAKTLLNTI